MSQRYASHHHIIYKKKDFQDTLLSVDCDLISLDAICKQFCETEAYIFLTINLLIHVDIIPLFNLAFQTLIYNTMN